MREKSTAGAFVAAGYAFGAGIIIALCSGPAQAESSHQFVHHSSTNISHVAYRHVAGHGAHGHYFAARGHGGHYRGGGGLQCVTFAREASGIELAGNAVDWWYNAEGTYQRGSRPEPGAVLNFRANGRMRLGHVAVVTQVIGDREVAVDQANWSYGPYGYGSITRAVHVVDVSPANDWTAVRVELGQSADFGSIYPTFGFIYNRPDGAPAPHIIQASAAPVPALNPPPADLRPSRERATALLPVRGFEQVAEAPDGISLQQGGLTFDAPDRSLR
jgi:CHAP domain